MEIQQRLHRELPQSVSTFQEKIWMGKRREASIDLEVAMASLPVVNVLALKPWTCEVKINILLFFVLFLFLFLVF